MNYKGISSQSAQKLLYEKGLNEIESTQKFSFFKAILETLTEPMLLILLFACGTYLAIGKLFDFIVLTISALVILSINIYQNYKTEESINKLKQLSKKYVEVIRDGIKQTIESKYLVEGDYLIVNEGDRIPADILIIESSNLFIDESILTGESVPISKKTIKDINLKKFNDEYIGFSGTLIRSGWVVGIVYKTGKNTKVGQIGLKLGSIKDEEPQVKKEINKIVFNLAIVAVLTCLFVFGYTLYKTSSLQNSLIYAITLAIALVPEELPIVLTIFLALSSLRLSSQGLIIKNKAIIETLGAANIICVDKTGTITKNNQKLKKIIIDGEELDFDGIDLNSNIKNLLQAAYLAKYFNSKDSMDLEIEEIFKKTGLESESFTTISEKVIDKKFIYSKKYQSGKNLYIFAKGAYEEISKLCRISAKHEDHYLNKIQELTNQGYRVIAIAKKQYQKEDGLKKFEFLGLMAFWDEVREETYEYIEACQNNSIRICMITGDYKNTAIYYAKKIGLLNPENVITGNEIETLSKKELLEKIKTTNVFARIEPQQKLKIVELFKETKNIVAMTGDGVNDALALKTANVGISVGEGGSDVAKETSDVILIENNLKNIIDGIKEGRRVYKNLGITARYIYSFHIPIILISVFNTFLELPQLLLPVHIAFLEFIIDPFSTLVFESIPAKAGVLAVEPRKGKFHLIKNMNLKNGTVMGVFIFILVFVPYYYQNQILNIQNSALALFNLLILNIILIYFNFSDGLKFMEVIKNKTFLIAISILITITITLFITRDHLNIIGLSQNFSPFEYLTLLLSSLIFIFVGYLNKKSLLN